MRTRIFMVVALLLGLQTELQAQLSTLTMRDGSTMRGYIAVQRPGQYVAFRTVDADVYIDNADELEIEEKYVPYSDLSAGWQTKASKSGAAGLSLCTITDGISSHPMAMIKERGATIRYEQHCDDMYLLFWTDIQRISRDDTDISSQSLLDQITMDDGTSYTGIVVEQNPGVSTKIKLRSGEIRVLQQSGIRYSRKIAKSTDTDLWDVRPYTNIVVLDDGTEHKGVIVSQYVGDDAYDSYVELYKSDGTQERINFIDIEEYRNEPHETLK